ncbi:MAG: phosphotransferase [Oscillospiraceae bacterium]|jgi:Ser/Thr protein kinase RdoA (MazF antagonist)|nr:phosphotransferase [Oscillospiraceae bacterium]
MKNFPVDTVLLSPGALGEFLGPLYFPGQKIVCRLYCRGINDTYRVLLHGKTHWLKVYRAGLHTQRAIQAEVDLLLYLQNAGVRACVPVPRINGGYACEFETVTGPRCGVLYETAGVSDFKSTQETPEKNARLGKYIARVHRALDEMPPVARPRLDCVGFIDGSVPYIREFAQVHGFDLPFVEDIALRTKAALAGLREDKPAFGLCHGDIYEGNLRLDEAGNPVLFDFDFAGYGWRAYDISLYACNFSLGADPAKHEARARRFEAFMEGYSRVRAMPEDELRTVPWFVPFRRIFNLGTLYLRLLADTWGDLAQIRNVEDDVALLKRWAEWNL